ncbi:S8 family serine peptidase [Methylomonas sp. EFPC3]|uniref:S8 family peptidase n=1 Tax=Methylomonas sp. EFPC3 TaxID=3021710 RepID=UPI00241625AE|nr:S8 family serine peptidase [Methylomonas sp. EFPC3]WFP49418.1 S8 family serine peptidase [Methylomonas sp. EFPC3]
MNRSRFTLALGLLLILAACAGNTPDLSQLGDSQTAEERRLLVTFVDRGINRVLAANVLDDYSSRSRYDNSDWSERQAYDMAARHHLEFVAQWPVTELGVSCVVYRLADSRTLEETIRSLQQDREVESVQPMHSYRVLAETPPATQGYSDPYLHLQAGFQSLHIAELHKVATGRGTRIAVIDTGIDTEHPDLKGQIQYSENTAPTPGNRYAGEFHGTAVAGILSAHPDNGIGIAGIAPHAEILAFRACWPEAPGALAAHCNSFTLALALNQALRMGSNIINLSLSGPEDPLLQRLIGKALAQGTVVVAAAPGSEQSGGFPANMEGVIAVSPEQNGDPRLVGAPGRDILTTVPHQAYDFMSGSSFAAPHVAGVAALLLQLHPEWSAAEIKRRLGNNAATANLLELPTALTNP